MHEQLTNHISLKKNLVLCKVTHCACRARGRPEGMLIRKIVKLHMLWDCSKLIFGPKQPLNAANQPQKLDQTNKAVTFTENSKTNIKVGKWAGKMSDLYSCALPPNVAPNHTNLAWVPLYCLASHYKYKLYSDPKLNDFKLCNCTQYAHKDSWSKWEPPRYIDIPWPLLPGPAWLSIVCSLGMRFI